MGNSNSVQVDDLPPGMPRVRIYDPNYPAPVATFRKLLERLVGQEVMLHLATTKQTVSSLHGKLYHSINDGLFWTEQEDTDFRKSPPVKMIVRHYFLPEDVHQVTEWVHNKDLP